MVITEFLERNARLYGSDTALVELNPSQERDSAVTWRRRASSKARVMALPIAGNSVGRILTDVPIGSRICS